MFGLRFSANLIRCYTSGVPMLIKREAMLTFALTSGSFESDRCFYMMLADITCCASMRNNMEVWTKVSIPNLHGK
jgi:hypothetical protein